MQKWVIKHPLLRRADRKGRPTARPLMIPNTLAGGEARRSGRHIVLTVVAPSDQFRVFARVQDFPDTDRPFIKSHFPPIEQERILTRFTLVVLYRAGQ